MGWVVRGGHNLSLWKYTVQRQKDTIQICQVVNPKYICLIFCCLLFIHSEFSSTPLQPNTELSKTFKRHLTMNFSTGFQTLVGGTVSGWRLCSLQFTRSGLQALGTQATRNVPLFEHF